MLHFLQTHLYIVLILLVFVAVVWQIIGRKREAHRRFEEMSQLKHRNDALNEALRNPQIKKEYNGSEGPMEISWDDKVIHGTDGKDVGFLAELVELSTYSRRKYVYRMDKPIRIGSGKGNQMEIFRDGVAEQHCEIFLNGNKACVRSIGGAQTVLKRGKFSALIGSDGVYLNNGDHIQIGTAEVQFKMYKA